MLYAAKIRVRQIPIFTHRDRRPINEIIGKIKCAKSVWAMSSLSQQNLINLSTNPCVTS